MTATHATTAPAPEARRAYQGALPVILVGIFMAALDFFIVNVAIPSIGQDLSAGPAAIQWVVAGYGLAYGAGLIIGGRLGDIYGRRRLYVIGLALFTLASLACGVAPSIGVLVAARILQGAAAALLTPQVVAIVRTVYTGAAQARAFSAYAFTMGLAAVFGQLIGGALIQADVFGLGWRACFLINLPIGIAALALSPWLVPESRGPVRTRPDTAGMVLVTATLVAVLLPLIQGREQGWPLWTKLSLLAAVVLLVGFIVSQQRRGETALINLTLFRERAFTAGLLAQLIFWLGQASFFLVFALYIQEGRGLTALNGGLVFAAIGAGYFITSLTAHRFARRLGRQVIAVGALVMAVALGLLLVTVNIIGNTGSVGWLLPALALDGLGMGLAVAPLATTVLARVTPTHTGSASGVLTTAQQIGNALGVALIGNVFYTQLEHDGSFPHAFGHSLIFLIAVEVALAALVQLLPRKARG